MIKENGKFYTPALSSFYYYWDSELMNTRQLILRINDKKDRDKFVKYLNGLEECIRKLGVERFIGESEKQ